VREDVLGKPERRHQVQAERLVDRLERLAFGRLVGEDVPGRVHQDLGTAQLLGDIGDDVC
jgi:hypothetical protein